jgi:glycosyltransferase involved in cell wall biosynthesis
MPRIAHLIETDGPGGAERVVAGLAADLQRAGGENVVITLGREGWLGREMGEAGVPVEVLPLDRPLSPRFARQLGGVLRRYGITIVHSHEFTMAVYGAWAAARVGAVHLFTMHGSRYYAGRLRRRVALRGAAALSGAVVAVSRGLARHLRRDLWIPASHLHTVPNGASLTPVARSSLRDELHLDAGARLIVTVGNLYHVKGHTHLLDALAVLTHAFPTLHVAIAGRGERESDLRARVTAQGVAGRVHFLGLRPDVANVLAAADVFVLPSLSEGLPLALLEAMLAGKPIVATAVGEIPIVLDSGSAGMLVRPGDPVALADAIGPLLADPTLRERFAAAARTRALAEYSFARMRERYVALYAALVTGRRGRTRAVPIERIQSTSLSRSTASSRL